ncbi:hypothetical protein PENTCL1PPCAC_21344, partial [Pristionchus entomophagus]
NYVSRKNDTDLLQWCNLGNTRDDAKIARENNTIKIRHYEISRIDNKFILHHEDGQDELEFASLTQLVSLVAWISYSLIRSRGELLLIHGRPILMRSR